ncbi:MAG: HAMP domain-containing histidine kinase [Myxococcales bacterium]|nr:HAMP domain-containing histidine kinase [Myxococcales bacterium]
MWRRLPLFARILVFFFANLIVVGLVVLGALRLRFALGPDPMVSLAHQLAFELESVSPTRWDAALAKRSRVAGVTLHLYTPHGERLAGPKIALPERVRARLAGPRPAVGPPGKLPAAGPPGKRPPPPWAKGKHPPPKGPPLLPPPPPLGPGAGAGQLFSVRSASPTRYWVGVPVVLHPTGQGPPRAPAVVLASSSSITGGGLFFDPWPWVLVVAMIVALSTLLWLPLVRSVTRPLRRMTEVTEQIAAGKFDARLDERRGDEIGRLSRAINEMSQRLAGLVGSQRRLIGDVAHELGSPIARIEVGLAVLGQRLEQTRQAAPGEADEDDRARVEDLAADVSHMSQLVEELLAFARAELEPSRVSLEQTTLAELVQRVVAREQRGRCEIEVDIDASIEIIADPRLVARAVGNLVRNAVRYAGDEGAIEVAAERAGERVRLEVRDRGAGVPEAHLADLFEPFYRVDDARSSHSGGTGLGLAIVKRCVEACGGSVVARNREGGGLVVQLELDGC